MQKNLAVMLAILIGAFLIFAGCGSKNVITKEESRFPINKRDTVMVNLKGVTDEKVIEYIYESVRVVVSYDAVMDRLEKFINSNGLTDDKALKTELLALYMVYWDCPGRIKSVMAKVKEKSRLS